MKKKLQGEFIRGPIMVDVLATLIKEGPPAALHTYLVLVFVTGLRKSDCIIPKYSHAQALGVNVRSFRRGLVILQAKGIITIIQHGPGVKTVVKLL